MLPVGNIHCRRRVQRVLIAFLESTSLADGLLNASYDASHRFPFFGSALILLL